ncbi:hypothetical protein OR1_03640 [Geobacter sp. OR-1]|uniref:tail fiber protein n=1 Tax=Geobacter sp. OR-1 TaxID=1266765 RepID=UPI000541A81B|nr:tail fiber protein [Geobacter sp. OR-1]GAM11327.1 hypothetical protein OR1_03640 [Geobacter sp. OR-1]
MFDIFSMKTLRVLFVITLASITIGMSAWGGPIPQKINYQGTLNNKSGGPANGSFNMTFRIYSTATGTNPIWAETWSTTNSSPVVVSDGVFNVMLGSITPLSNDFFALHPKTYLGISVANDSEFLPRQMLASVGYAFAAGNGIPKGGIIMWSGTTVPEGWALCDGTNGTPNLLDKFIVGAGSGYTLGATGGESTHILTVAEMPRHNHTDAGHLHVQPGGWSPLYIQPGGGNYSRSSGSGYASVDAYGYANISYTGSNAAHENRPPYYALAFIMKL